MSNTKHKKCKSIRNQLSVLYEKALSRKVGASLELCKNLENIFLDKARNIFAAFSSLPRSLLNYDLNRSFKDDSRINSSEMLPQIQIKSPRLRSQNKKNSDDPLMENSQLSSNFYGDKNSRIVRHETDNKIIRTRSTIHLSYDINKNSKTESNNSKQNTSVKFKKTKDNDSIQNVHASPNQLFDKLNVWYDFNNRESETLKQSLNLGSHKSISLKNLPIPSHQRSSELTFWDDLTGVNVAHLKRNPSLRNSKSRSVNLHASQEMPPSEPITSHLSRNGIEVTKSSHEDSARILRSTKSIEFKKSVNLNHAGWKTSKEIKEELIKDMKFNFSIKLLNHKEASLNQEAFSPQESNVLKKCEKEKETSYSQTLDVLDTLTEKNSSAQSRKLCTQTKAISKLSKSVISEENPTESSFLFQNGSENKELESSINNRNCKILLKKSQILDSLNSKTDGSQSILNENELSIRILRKRKYKAMNENSENDLNLVQSKKINSLGKNLAYSLPIRKKNLETNVVRELQDGEAVQSSPSTINRCEYSQEQRRENRRENISAQKISQQNLTNSCNDQGNNKSETLKNYLSDSCKIFTSSKNFKRQLRVELKKIVTERNHLKNSSGVSASKSETSCSLNCDSKYFSSKNSRLNTLKKFSTSESTKLRLNSPAENDSVNTSKNEVKVVERVSDFKKIDFTAEEMNLKCVEVNHIASTPCVVNNLLKKESINCEQINTNDPKREKIISPSSNILPSYQPCSELTFWDDLTGINVTNMKQKPKFKPPELQGNQSTSNPSFYNQLKLSLGSTQTTKTHLISSSRILRSTKELETKKLPKLNDDSAKSSEEMKKELIENMRFNFSVKYLNNNIIKNEFDPILSVPSNRIISNLEKKIDILEADIIQKNKFSEANNEDTFECHDVKNEPKLRNVVNSLSIDHQQINHTLNQKCKSDLNQAKFSSISCKVETKISNNGNISTRILNRRKCKKLDEKLENAPVLSKSKTDKILKTAPPISPKQVEGKLNFGNCSMNQFDESSIISSPIKNCRAKEKTSDETNFPESSKIIDEIDQKLQFRNRVSSYLTSSCIQKSQTSFEELNSSFTDNYLNINNNYKLNGSFQPKNLCSSLPSAGLYHSSSAEFCDKTPAKSSNVECKPCSIYVEDINKKIDFCKQLELQLIYLPPKRKKVNSLNRTNLSFHTFPKKYRKLRKKSRVKV